MFATNNVPEVQGAETALGEEALLRIREALRGTSLFSTMRVEGIPMTHLRLDALKISSEAGNSWDYVRLPKAGFFRLSTENRLAFIEHFGKIADALRGLPVSASLNPSWRWDASSIESLGHSTYIPVYEIFVIPNARYGRNGQRAEFHPAGLLAAVAQMCRSADPRADMNLFDYQRDHKVGLFNGYQWIPEGVVVSAATRVKAEAIQKELFPDCTVEVAPRKKPGQKRADGWLVTVRFPDVLRNEMAS